jgi:type I restriction enzyme S subunit
MALPVIPDDWEMVTVGSIALKKPNSIVGGPFGSDLVSTDYAPAGVPVIRGQNMGQAFVSGDFVFVSDEKAKTLSSNLAAPGDVVFTQRGTLGQVSIVPNSPFDRYLISQSQMKLSIDPQRFDVAFLCQYFSSAAGQQQILESAIQTGVPHTNLTILRAYFLPRPPLPEQQAIAAALSDADGVVAGLERVIAKKRLIKQGAMQDLLTARRRLPGFSGEWEVVRLSDVGTFKSGSGFPLNAQGKTTGRYPFFKVSDFSNQGNERTLNRANHYIDESDRQRIGARVFQPGTIAFAKIGAAIFLERKRLIEQESCLDNNMAGYTLQNERVSGHLILANLQHFSLGSLVASTALPAIGSGELNSIAFRMPSSPQEQQAISAVLSDIDAEIQTLESHLTKARAVKEGMMQNLLTGRVRLI